MNCIGTSEDEYNTVRQSNKKATLTIQGSLPSLNQYTRACRSNKYVGAKMKKDAEQVIGLYIMQQLKTSFDGRIKLAFRWYCKDKRQDLDNICFAKKFILDALVANSVIVGDGWRCVTGFTDDFFVDAKNPRIEVDIYEL